MVRGPAETIGHLGGGLRPPLIRGTQIVIIYYIILLSHLKKNYKQPSPNPIRPRRPVSHRGKKKGLQMAITKSHQAMKARFSQGGKKRITNGHHQIPSGHEGLFLIEARFSPRKKLK